jgi:hypothetical protein
MKLFIDDIREPPEAGYIIARSSNEAINIVKKQGWPTFMSLDHDLGDDDTTMVFLKRLVEEIWDGKQNPPDYKVHSANPIGTLNIKSFMESWRKSL